LRGRAFIDVPFVAASVVGTTPSIRYPEGVFDLPESNLGLMFKFLRFLVIANSANHSEQCGQNLYLKAGKNVVIEAGTMLTLKVGGNFICLTPAAVFISGTMVNINSGGSAGTGTPCNLVSPASPGQPAMPVDTQPTGTASYTADASRNGASGSTSAGANSSGANSGPTHQSSAEENKEKTHWVAIELVDEAGQPVTGEAFEIKLPDGSFFTGTTDEKGCARTDHIDPGSCQITFPKLDGEAWQPG
jgi:type VI secretion system secreted protein VgrG